MENYKDILGAIIRDREAADKKSREDLNTARKAKGDMQRAFLEPITLVLTQLKTQELERHVYFFDDTIHPDCGLGNACWKVSARDIYAKYDGGLIIQYSTAPSGESIVWMMWTHHGNDVAHKSEYFQEPVEAIPVVLSVIADMVRHR